MQAKDTHYVVCPPADWARAWDDDVDATCSRCGRAIFHRPHVLRDLPHAQLICIACMLALKASMERGGLTPTYGVTETTRREVDEERRKRRH